MAGTPIIASMVGASSFAQSAATAPAATRPFSRSTPTEGGGTWLGEVTDPRDGGQYQAKLWVDDSGNLRLRGFIGIPALGATQTWHRFTGHLTTECRLAPS